MWCAISTYSHCLVSRLALLYFAISFIQAKALITSCKLIKMSVILTKWWAKENYIFITSEETNISIRFFLLSWEINSSFSNKMKKKYSLHTTISQHKNKMFIVLKNRHRLSISIIAHKNSTCLLFWDVAKSLLSRRPQDNTSKIPPDNWNAWYEIWQRKHSDEC